MNFIKRDTYIKKLLENKDNKLIKILTGTRRVGKSTILKMYIDELKKLGIKKSQILYINFESLKNNIRDFKDLYSNINKKHKYILLDEIQLVEQWQKAINSFIVDFDVDIYITGSNATLLSSELSTLLSGRYIEIDIYSLSFQEYIDFYQKNDQKNLEELFWQYTKYGGLPGLIYLKEDNENNIQNYLNDILNSVIFKDLTLRNNLRNIDLIEKVLTFLFSNIGNIFSAKSIVEFFKSQNRKHSIESIYAILSFLTKALITYKVNRFDLKGKKLLETLEKYYVTDLGLRYALVNFSPNFIPGILENIIFLELKRRDYVVYIGKIKDKEIDFIATKNNNTLLIQVSYLLFDPKTIEREINPLHNYESSGNKIILSMDKFPTSYIKNIRFQNIIDFILDKSW